MKLNMETVAGYEAMTRAAVSLSKSTLVPESYRGVNGAPNCMIALNLAQRLHADVLMVMQNLYIVKGRPGWSGQFLIATANTAGKFTPLRFEWQGKAGDADWGCRAVAKDVKTGEKLEGAWITTKMCQKEGWWTKKSKDGAETSKWQSMPEQMFMYRAAAFWVRVYAPEVSMGLYTAEELHDIRERDLQQSPAMVVGDPKFSVPEAPAAPKVIEAEVEDDEETETVDEETGETEMDDPEGEGYKGDDDDLPNFAKSKK